MIKVMDKTFGILEEIVKSTPHPMGPLALSEKLGLNRATCSRILKVLLESGYILQVSRQAGYVAGPRILTLNNMAGFQSRLLKKAVPVIENLARELKISVLISQIYQHQRYVLYLTNYSPELNIRLEQLAYEDIFHTATGIVGIAYQTASEQMALYDAINSKDVLPEFRERGKVKAALEKIRKDAFYHAGRNEQGIFAAPIFANQRFLASLGCSIPLREYTPENIPVLSERLRNAAQEISRSLSSLDSIG